MVGDGLARVAGGLCLRLCSLSLLRWRGPGPEMHGCCDGRRTDHSKSIFFRVRDFFDDAMTGEKIPTALLCCMAGPSRLDTKIANESRDGQR